MLHTAVDDADSFPFLLVYDRIEYLL